MMHAYVQSVKSIHDYFPDVQICKLENMYESRHKRLCVHIQAPQPILREVDGKVVKQEDNPICAQNIFPIMKKIFQRIDKQWKILPGVPPQGAQSRRAQKLLDMMPQSLDTDKK